ncbi:hypothetical protein COB21_00560, partial [Candidatus Aerophobetes bacterium]
KKYKNEKGRMNNPNGYYFNPHTVCFSLQSPATMAQDMIEKGFTNEDICAREPSLSLEDVEKLRQTSSEHNLVAVAKKTGGTIYDLGDLQKLHQEKNRGRVVYISGQDISLLDFDPVKEKQAALLQGATDQTRRFFEGRRLGVLGGGVIYDYAAFQKKQARGVINLPMPLPQFTGRKKEIKSLEEKLAIAGDDLAIACLVGKRGSGKSVLAGAFAALNLKQFSLMCKIDHRNREAFDMSYRKLAAALGIAKYEKMELKPLQEAVNKSLEGGVEGQRWLLIHDNVDEGSIPLGDMPTKGGSVLITSADEESFTGDNVIEVGGLTRESSCQLIREMTGNSGPEVEQLADSLGDIPLLIHLAASHMEQTGVKPEDYRQNLLSHCPEGAIHREDLFKASWKVAAAALKESYPDALKVLVTVSFFDNDAILKSWIGQLLAPGPKERSRLKFEKTVGVLHFLSRFGMVFSERHSETFSMHGYFQEIIRDSEEATVEDCEEALKLVMATSEVANYNPNAIETLGGFRDNIEHFITLTHHAKNGKIKPQEIAPLVFKVMRFYMETKRDINSAEIFMMQFIIPLLDEGLSLPLSGRGQFLMGLETLKRASDMKRGGERRAAHSCRASAFYVFKSAQKDFESSEPGDASYKGLEQNKSKCTREYQIATCMLYQAQVLADTGQDEEALALFQQAEDRFVENFGKIHFDVARIMRERAKISFKTNKQKGIDELNDAIDRQRQVYDDSIYYQGRFNSFKTVAVSFSILGDFHYESGSWKDADDAYKTAYEINTRANGGDKNVYYNKWVCSQRALIAKELNRPDMEKAQLALREEIENAL